MTEPAIYEGMCLCILLVCSTNIMKPHNRKQLFEQGNLNKGLTVKQHAFATAIHSRV